MKGHPGVSGKVFGALGRHNINISAIARALQSATFLRHRRWRSKRVRWNISIKRFSSPQTPALVVIGVGNIGGNALLRQLHEQRA